MRVILLALAVTLLYGCAAQGERQESDAVDDFIKVAELEEVDAVRTHTADSINYEELNEDYVILRTRRDYYLAKFVGTCYELRDMRPTPDVRRDPNTLRARFDTIRGCRIGNIYVIDKAQAEELRQLGEMLGER